MFMTKTCCLMSASPLLTFAPLQSANELKKVFAEKLSKKTQLYNLNILTKKFPFSFQHILKTTLRE